MKETPVIGSVTLNATIGMQHRLEGKLSCRYRLKQISGLVPVWCGGAAGGPARGPAGGKGGLSGQKRL